MKTELAAGQPPKVRSLWSMIVLLTAGGMVVAVGIAALSALTQGQKGGGFGSLGVPELVVLMLMGGSIGAYLLPTIVALARKKRNLLAIVLVNVLLGWTVIGWVVALVWAVSTQMVDAQTPVGSVAAALCASCGKYNPPAAGFCAHCGAAMSGVTR